MATSLTVDRSELADTAQPDQLAALLIDQLVSQLDPLLPVPVVDVAQACGIIDFQMFDTDAFEGGLIQDENKERGIILLRAGAYERRSRFTIAHELGHFLNLRHVAPPGSSQLMCSKADMRVHGTGNSRHSMEAQANEFAVGLLMPRRQLAGLSFMKGSPEIGRILTLHELCNVSKEAAARRYAELHGGDFAIVFTKDGRLAGWPIRGGDFPWLDLKPDQSVFRDTLTKMFSGSVGAVSEQEESDTSWWLQDSDRGAWELWEEVLVQSRGYRMTLLLGERNRNSYTQHKERWTPRLR